MVMSNKNNPPSFGNHKKVISKFGAAPATPFTQAMRLFQTGKISAAEKVMRNFLKTSPNNPDALHLMGLILFKKGNPSQSAETIGKAVIASGGKNPTFHANHGLALKAAGKLEQARTAYKSALGIDASNPGWWNDQGNVLSQLGFLVEAESSYRRALELAPRDVKTWVNLANILVAQGRFDDAISSSHKAVELSPQLPQAHNALGNALNQSGQIDEAIEAFKKALSFDRRYGEAIGNLASCFEINNKTDDARELIEGSNINLKEYPHLSLILAKCDRRDNQLQAALHRLENIKRQTLPAPLHRDIAFELSRLYDRVENVPAAFAAMAEGNKQFMISEGVDEHYGDSFFDTLEDLQSWYTPERVKSLSSGDAGSEGELDPIFLIGFPRSGTTLLGQILDSHSALIMVEERPMLDGLVAKLENSFGGYPQGLEKLTPKDIIEFRQTYFTETDLECDRQPGQRIVDKFPLHLVHVGLILKIFPRSKFIFALRHPCDAVLSCFMQSFSLNPAMANFLSTERAAKTYDLVMSLWQHYEGLYTTDHHAIRYEDVVDDFDDAIGGLLAFLGLDWQDSVKDYAENARAKGNINTPSYYQVTEAIYTRARYRWLRYEHELQPIMKTLNPWIKTFGYDQE